MGTWKKGILQPCDVLDWVHEFDAKQLPGNCTWTITKMLQMEMRSIERLVLQRFSFSWHITFNKRWVSLHPTAEILPRHLLRALKKVTSSLDIFMTTPRAWRRRRHVTTRKIPLLTSQPTTTPALLSTFKSAHHRRQMTLENFVPPCFRKNDWGRKVSWLTRMLKSSKLLTTRLVMCTTWANRLFCFPSQVIGEKPDASVHRLQKRGRKGHFLCIIYYISYFQCVFFIIDLHCYTHISCIILFSHAVTCSETMLQFSTSDLLWSPCNHVLLLRLVQLNSFSGCRD